VRKQGIALLFLLPFACVETVLACDYILVSETGNSPSFSAWAPSHGQNFATDLQISAELILWRNSFPLAATSWAVLCITFFRGGISRKWRSLGFDKDVFSLMVVMKGAQSRVSLLANLNEPRHKTELTRLAGLDWKEVDREIKLLERLGLISLYAQSGSVKMYKLSEHGKLLLKLISELKEIAPETVGSMPSAYSDARRL
jgi:predicted transcriptional regulator